MKSVVYHCVILIFDFSLDYTTDVMHLHHLDSLFDTTNAFELKQPLCFHVFWFQCMEETLDIPVSGRNPST